MEKTNVTTTETTNVTPPAAKRRYWWKAIASFLMVLFTMPLGHGLMIIMEHLMSETVLHYSAFVMGAVGMAMVIVGVFAKGDTRQTLWGFFGGLLFWTGWVEFLFMYFANRFGTQPELDPVTGEIVTRPEYLILPASFGFWMMIMVILKSATKLFSVLLASKRPLITELADKLRLKYPLLPTISPCPTMRLEAIRSIIPISCRRYPKSV
ncbi:hypothetical protein M076_4638 [Bacteroides fragilis str. 2-F-2 |uniref:Transmembrane protein n=1 Tax=Bacteroides fragilis str. 2-F-2 \|nr:hypothetical protein M076_4638 [Bacteroides fragilis str. 2-F-2 \